MLNALLSIVVAVFLAGPAFAQAAPPAYAWGDVLPAHVVVSDDGVARVRYGALKTDADARRALDVYLAQFETADLSRVSDENFANWINIYNAATIRHIVSRYPIDSIKDGYLFGGPWKKVSVTVNGRPVSLHAIEHTILRKQYKDPRLHYALNCASYGCPNLKQSLWEADTLDADLTHAAVAFINHPRGVSATSNGLTLSRIYDWYRDDFGGTDEAIRAHLSAYADPALLSALSIKPPIRKYSYDWSLNDAK